MSSYSCSLCYSIVFSFIGLILEVVMSYLNKKDKKDLEAKKKD